MLADPQSVTINAVAQSLPRTPSGDNNAGVFTKEDGTLALKISHSYAKRTRRQVRLDFNKITADPLVPSQNQKISGSVYLVIDQPVTGYTNAELKQHVEGFLAWLSASSGAKITTILGGEA